jgi:hypothetical protein
MIYNNTKKKTLDGASILTPFNLMAAIFASLMPHNSKGVKLGRSRMYCQYNGPVRTVIFKQS